MSRLALVPILMLVAPAALAAQDTLAPPVALPLSIPRPSVAPIDTTARPISLDEAVRLAQRNSPQTVQARGLERTARASVRSAYAAFIPAVDVSLRSSRQSGDRIGPSGNLIPFTGPPTSYNSGINARVDVFDGGRRLFDIRRARAEVNAADAATTSQSYQVALNVKQQYFAVLAAREQDAAARVQLQQAEQQLRAAAARVAAGAATKSDSLRSVIQVGNARLALATAENALRVANATLTRLVASPHTVTALPGDTADVAVVALDSAELARLATYGPAVQQAESQLTAARAATRAARTPYLPTVSLNYSRGGNGYNWRYGLGANTVPCTIEDDSGNPVSADCANYTYSDALTFSVNFPLFNQWQREEQYARASVAQDNAEAQLRDTRLLAEQNLIQYVGAMRTAQERVAIQEASVAAATEDLRVQQQRYALGASTLLDLLTSQTQLSQAQAALIQARYDYRVARAQLEALVGRDLTAGTSP